MLPNIDMRRTNGLKQVVTHCRPYRAHKGGVSEYGLIEVFVDDTDEEEVLEEAKLEENSAADEIDDSDPYFLMV